MTRLLEGAYPPGVTTTDVDAQCPYDGADCLECGEEWCECAAEDLDEFDCNEEAVAARRSAWGMR